MRVSSIIAGCVIFISCLLVPAFAKEELSDAEYLENITASNSTGSESNSSIIKPEINIHDNDLENKANMNIENNLTTPDFTQIPLDTIEDSGQGATSIAWGDFDNDNDLDLAYAMHNCRLMENLGNDNFEFFADFADPAHDCGGDTCRVAWADYNNDGWCDIAYGSMNTIHPYYLFRNLGGPGPGEVDFQPQRWFGARQVQFIAWADVNLDGNVDFVASNGNGNPPGPMEEYHKQDFLAFNKGEDADYGFTLINIFGTTGAFAFGDYDDDGDMDLATGRTDFPIYRNNGDGTFTGLNQLLTGITVTGALSWGDCNNDGLLDLAINPGNNYIYLFIRNPLECITPFRPGPILSIPSGRAYSIAWGDYNNDGFLDLAVANPNYGCANCLFESNGDVENLAFTRHDNFDPTQNNPVALSVAWGDYDRDGDLDLATGHHQYDEFTNLCEVYRNNLYTPETTDKRFIAFQLEGGFGSNGDGFSNTSAIGARVYVYQDNWLGEPTKLLGFRQVASNCSSFGVDSLEVEFGIPASYTGQNVDVLVKWPGSNDSHIEESWNEAIGQYYTLEEDSGTAYIPPSPVSTTPIQPQSFSIQKVYPNPANASINLTFDAPKEKVIEITVYDLAGRVVREEKLETSGTTTFATALDVSTFSNGIYTIKAVCGSEEATSRVVVVK